MTRKCIFWATFYAVLCGMAVLAWGQMRPECCPDCVEIGRLYGGGVLEVSAAELGGVAWRAGATLYLVDDRTWADCLTGPIENPAESLACASFDADLDGDVDLRDFAEGVR